MPRYVVLFHENPSAERESHWDLMLEVNDCLLTWELNTRPDKSVGWHACKQLKDHRLAYLDYEGPISNNRGHVTRWDAGEFEWVSRSDASDQLRLHGSKLRGMLFLAKQNSAWRYRFDRL